MSDEIVLAGKTYTASKKAASISGYAQDYIGQLARGGAIEAQRVGGLWYVAIDSLEAYQKNAGQFTPTPPTNAAPKDLDTVVSFDGKDYVSASRAAKITGYNQDYIGQLARSGKILSRQIGNRWYVERNGLVAHKSAKDALLGAVQSDAVGLARAPLQTPQTTLQTEEAAPFYTYVKDDGELMPTLMKREELEASGAVTSLPIRIASTQKILHTPVSKKHPNSRSRTTGKTRHVAAKALVALTVVLVLSYSLMTLKSGSKYASLIPSSAIAASHNALSASAANAIDSIGAFLERLLVREIVYTSK